MRLVLVICVLSALSSKPAQGHPGCDVRGPPDHGRVRVILQRAAGVMVAYSCDPGHRRTGHAYSVCLRGMWTTPLPECIPTTDHSAAGMVGVEGEGEVSDGDGAARDQGVLVSHEELPTTQRSVTVRKVKHMRKKRKRKRKGKIFDPLATAGSESTHEPSLDSSCLLSSPENKPKFVRAPNVPNSLGPKFVRRKTGSKKYLVAVYRCLAGYKLHNPLSRSLGCQNSKWVGTLPICLPRRRKLGCINAGCDHGCKEVNDKPKCYCFKGFRQSGKHCFDENECLVDNGGCQQACHNTPGSFYCSCPPGYRLATDRTSCVDINECLSRNGHGPCQGHCHNVDGSFYCSCEAFPGSQLADDGVSCADINECNDPIHRLGCSHACVNTRGSAFCLCPPGYELGNDWKTCQDINECEQHIAQCVHGCINTIGSFICTSQTDCHDGYLRLNGTCQDVDECAINASICSHNCLNIPGSFVCSCPTGFVMDQDGRTCTDIDECSEYAEGHLCSHICQNTLGSYNCLCPTDYELASDHRTCHPQEDECQRKNCSHDCVIENGRAECVCDAGYTLEDEVTCLDVDECEENHTCSHGCVNEEGTFYCTCPVEYSLQADKKTCIKKEHDVNDCTLGHTNGNRSLNCACPKGFERIDGDCSDIDECEMGESLCSQLCRNNEGGYECYCRDGYQLDEDQKTCRDINECQEQNICPNNKTCVNTEGSYWCNCPTGFREGNVTSDCVDIDECSFTIDEGSSLCSHVCINSLGSFHCECPLGYVLGRDSRTCEDIDECSDNNEINAMCSHKLVHYECPEGFVFENNMCVAERRCEEHNGGCSHMCKETKGQLICECPEGLILANDNTTCISHLCPDNSCLHSHGKQYHFCLEGYKYEENIKQCVDIDECLNNNGNCSQRCENTDGSYTCSCFLGFEENDSQCIDINECTKNLSTCSQICLNTEGSYKCECYNGYMLSESYTECLDIDECANNTVCDHICYNLEGTFKCGCNPGYILSSDGESCQDVNECLLNTSNCNQICKNVDGGFYCECEPGYKLVNNSVCVDINVAEGKHCERSNVIAENESTCCCESGYVLVNETQCVHSSVCHLTPNCNLSLSESSICQSSDTTAKTETNRQDCPTPDNSVELNCNNTVQRSTDVYPAGVECHVSCRSGYKLDGTTIIKCLNGSWSESFKCIAHVRPYIRCPPALRLNLPSGKNSTIVNIPQPKTNVDWEKHITSKPPWGKHLQKDLPLGTVSVQFSAASPSSKYVAKCIVTIQVTDAERPNIEGCPGEMKVVLQPGMKSTQVTWPEPTITDNVKVAHLYQSQRPGVVLTKGAHTINYIAADSSGNIAACQFTILVVDAN